MSRADWRTPGSYEELRSLDAPSFAWEYLRRNSDFLRILPGSTAWDRWT